MSSYLRRIVFETHFSIDARRSDESTIRVKRGRNSNELIFIFHHKFTIYIGVFVFEASDRTLNIQISIFDYGLSFSLNTPDLLHKVFYLSVLETHSLRLIGREFKNIFAPNIYSCKIKTHFVLT